ncbi:hypothetical protein J4429_06210 [Candidatus Pacearchaeota archaeon]|nr:hypothetical protein [Candidatus Pacearchaeota archaeon]
MDLGNYYILKRCEKFGGLCVPLVETKSGLINVSSRLRDFYVGQESIVKALQSWECFEAHAEWIARLRKLYIEDQQKPF